MTDKTNIQTRIAQLREQMSKHQVQALIVPSDDPHMSEYLPEYYQGRAYFSGFTGSVGTLVVAENFAHIWVDSRYWLQAEGQLAGTGIELKKLEPTKPAHADYLVEHLPQGSVVAVDDMVLSVAEYERLTALFAPKGITLKTVDLIDDVWENRPAIPSAPVYVHAEAFVDTSASQKLAKVRAAMQDKKASYHLISSLDDIAWLTNLRGQDVNCNPVFLAHLLIDQTNAALFVNPNKLDVAAKAQLDKAGIQVRAYEEVYPAMAEVTESLLIDGAKVAIGTIKKLPKEVALIKAMNPSTLLKAVKSDADLAHIRVAMAQDGAALCEFFAEFEAKIARNETVTEVDIDGMLIEARSRQPYYRGPSFDSIVGFRGNGALAHYRATPDSHSTIAGDGLLLIDSGCQFDNGTTDITRMVGVGHISDEAKKDVTYVLKSHIALAQAVFPVGTPSPMLDMIARQPMWQAGLNYGHGTGHGVGYFMNVHEGPQVIAYNAPITPERTMLKGMVSSNEPGLYREGKWGIRIENLVATVSAPDSEFGEFLCFEDLTLCPIDTRIILPELLTKEEKAWLNEYHQKVHDALIERVEGDAKAWLIARTQPV